MPVFRVLLECEEPVNTTEIARTLETLVQTLRTPEVFENPERVQYGIPLNRNGNVVGRAQLLEESAL